MMPTKKVLLFAFGGVVASFIGATGYAEYRANEIDAIALELADRTSATGEQLAQRAHRIDALEHAHAAAEQIRAIRRRSQLTAFALDFVCAGFASLAFALALGSHRSHTELLQRRSDELEQFAGRVAHDILSPLSTVRISLDRQMRAHADAPAQHEMVMRASRSLSRVQVIIDGLLLFAKAGAQPEPGASCDASEVVADVVAATRPAAEGAGVDLRVQTGTGLIVPCSTGVLMSVVSNLINNAVKYIGKPPEAWVEVRAAARDDLVRIEVEDNGSGIADDVIGTIFEPYVRGRGLHQSGIGLGLATVKRIVEAHHGAVGVESAVGRGSRFWVELPRASAPKAA